MAALTLIGLLALFVGIVMLVVNAIRKRALRVSVIVTGVGLVGLITGFVGLIIGAALSSPSPASTQFSPSNPTPTSSVVKVTCDQIMSDCDNEISFDLKYKGKTVQVTGCIVQQVSSTSNPRVTVTGKSIFSGSFTCPFSSPVGLEKLVKGETVTVQGLCYGVMLGDPDLRDCSIVH